MPGHTNIFANLNQFTHHPIVLCDRRTPCSWTEVTTSVAHSVKREEEGEREGGGRALCFGGRDGMGRERRSTGASSSGASAALGGGGAASGVASLFGARPSERAGVAAAAARSPGDGVPPPALAPGADVLPDQSDVDAGLQRLLVRLGKKDSATRIKALGDVVQAVAPLEGEGDGRGDMSGRVVSAMPTWLYFYRRLVLDGDRAVRQGAAGANAALCVAAGRALAPLLQSAALPWWLAMHDPEEDAAVRTARSGWEALFPDPAKRAAAVARVRLSLVRQLGSTLVAGKAALVKSRFEGIPAEEAEQRVCRLLGASALGLSALLAETPQAAGGGVTTGASSSADSDGVHEVAVDLAAGSALGKLVGGGKGAAAPALVRKAVYRLLGSLCGFLKAGLEHRGGGGSHDRGQCVDGMLPLLVAALGRERDTACQSELIAAIVVASGAFPAEAWGGSLLDTLGTWLDGGARGAAPGAAPFLLPLMATMPKAVLGREAAGIVARIVSGESSCAHDASSVAALRDAAVECLVYAAVKAGGNEGAGKSAAMALLEDVALAHFWPERGSPSSSMRRPLSMAALLNARALCEDGTLESEGKALAGRVFSNVVDGLLGQMEEEEGRAEAERESVIVLVDALKGASLRGEFAATLASGWAGRDCLPYTAKGESATASVLNWLLALTKGADAASVLPVANEQLAAQIARCTWRSSAVLSDAADLFVRLTSELWITEELPERGDAFRDAAYGVLVDNAVIEDPPLFISALPSALAKRFGREYSAWYRYRSAKLDDYARNVLVGPYVKDVTFEPPELAGKKQVALVTALLGEPFRPALLGPRENKFLHGRLCWRLKLWTMADGGGDPLEFKDGERPPNLYQLLDAGFARRESAPLLLLECCARCILRPAPEDPASLELDEGPKLLPRVEVVQVVGSKDRASKEKEPDFFPPVTDKVVREPHLTRLLMIKHYGHRMVRDKFVHFGPKVQASNDPGANDKGALEGSDEPREPLWHVWQAVWNASSPEERESLAQDAPGRRSMVKLAFAESQLVSMARRARVEEGGRRLDALSPIGEEEAESAAFILEETLGKFCSTASHRASVAAALCREPGLLWTLLKEEVVRRGYGFPQLTSKRRILVLAALLSFGEDLASCWEASSSDSMDFSVASSTLAAFLGADASPVFMSRCLPRIVSWGLSDRGPAMIESLLRALVPECPCTLDAVPISFEELADPIEGTPPPTKEWMSDLPILEERCTAEEAWTGVLPVSCIGDVASWLFPFVISRIAPGDARSLFRRSHLLGRVNLPTLLLDDGAQGDKLSFSTDHARVVAKSASLVIRRMLRPVATDHAADPDLALAEWDSLNGAAAWDAEQMAAEWREAARQCCHSRARCAPQVLDACSAVAVATFGRHGVRGPAGPSLGDRLLHLELFRSFALPLLTSSLEGGDDMGLWGSETSQACLLRHVASVFEVGAMLLEPEELATAFLYIQERLYGDCADEGGDNRNSATAAHCAATSVFSTRVQWLPGLTRSGHDKAVFAWESLRDDATLSALGGVLGCKPVGGGGYGDGHNAPETLQDWQAECLTVSPRDVLGQLVLEDSIGPLVALIRGHPSQRLQRAAYTALLASEAQFTYMDEALYVEGDEGGEGDSQVTQPSTEADRPTRLAIPADLLTALGEPPTAAQVRDHSDHRGLGSYLLLWSAFLEHLRRRSGSEGGGEWAVAAALAVRQSGAASACFSVAFAVASASPVPEPTVPRPSRKEANGGPATLRSSVGSHGYFALLDRASEAWDGRLRGFFDDAEVVRAEEEEEAEVGAGEEANASGASWKAPPPDEPWSVVRLGRLVLLRLMQHIPSVARVWFAEDIPRSMISQVESFCAEHVSPVLITQELEAVAWEAAKKPKVLCAPDGKPLPPALQPVEPLKLAVRRGRNEAVATYKQDESMLELRVALPRAYPLRAVEVEGPRRAGVSERTSRRWLLGILTYLRNGDGCVLDAIRMWRRHVEAAFDGVEECAVCYFVVHAANHSLPTKPCPQCKHKFHRACLVKWFNTSHKTNCPLCRGAFDWRIRNPELPPAMRGLPPDVQQELIAMGMHMM